MNLDEVAALLGVPFTSEQRRAIAADPHSPLQIVAGAGSGKTTVMAARVVWLVANEHAAPEQVLGLTFTNKAAASLAARVTGALALLGGAGSGREPDDTELGPTVSTYHAYAARLVREHGLRIGVEPDLRLLADATRFQLAHRVMRAHHGPLPSLKWVPDTVVSRLIALEGACSDHLVDPAGLQRNEYARAAELERALAELPGDRGIKTRQADLRKCVEVARGRAELCELVLAYRAAKRRVEAADFGDQAAWAVRVAEQCPDAVELERARFRVVLLDEYQDTSVAQSRLLTAMFGDGRPVTSVGDPCQAIYGWRGASVQNLITFPLDFPSHGGEPAHVRPLRTSQRSGGRLLALANTLSAGVRAESAVDELQSRPDRIDVGEVVVARHERYDQERAWIAEQVRSEIAAGTPPVEIAVLLRAWRHAGPLHQALTDAGVPVEVVGLGGLLALPEVADVVATLQVVDDPAANAALLRLLAGPRFMFGAQDLRALGGLAARLAYTSDPELDPLDEAAAGVDTADIVALADGLDALAHGAVVPGLSVEAANRAVVLHREISALRRAAGEPLPDLVSRVIASTGLDVESAASPEAVSARRRASLAAFTDIAAEYADLDGGAELHGFLGYLRAAEDYDRGFDNPLEVSGNAVQILTMHKAKGLEWDVVVLPDLTDKAFPALNTDGRWHTNIGELPFRERQDASSLPADPDFGRKGWKQTFEDCCKSYERREEDRLAYVAVTRARRKIIASNALWGPTQRTARKPSPYLEQLREHAEAGFGTVDRWYPDEDAEARNPYLDLAPTQWPATLDPAALDLRTAAARAVYAGPCPSDPIAAASGVTAADRLRFARYDREIASLLEEARAHRAPEIEVPLPAALSASQVLTLREDPDRLAADLARPMPRRPSVAAVRGTAFHAWVEEHFALTPLLDADALAGAADEALTDTDLAELKSAFLDSEWAGRTPYAIEAGFAVVLGGRLVRGRIDAVYEVPPAAGTGIRWHVVDWKTGRESADPLQLAIYRTAWARQQGCPDSAVRASFLSIRSGRILDPALPDAGELDRLLGGE